MNDKQVLKLALELLESAHVATDLVWKRHDAVEAIKEALAEPKQEPEAWQVKYRDDEGISQIAWFPHPVHSKSPLAKRPYTEEPLYTTPPQREWVGLTDEEIDRLNFTQVRGCHCSLSYIDGIEEFAKSIEVKLREKNG